MLDSLLIANRGEIACRIIRTARRLGVRTIAVHSAADRGALHLEARYNYESIGARSAFVGWTFSGGETVTWEVTPLLGGAWGTTQAFVPGLEASVAWGPVDFYVEAEYVRDNHESTDSYAYAWSELGFRPVEWLRVGVAGQRTRAYGNDLTALMWAAGQGQADTVTLLLARGARTDLTDDRDFTALRAAQDNGHTAVVALLAAR